MLQSQQSKDDNSFNTDNCNLLSPTARQVLKEVSCNRLNKTSVQEKFQQKEGNKTNVLQKFKRKEKETIVPEPDLFCKKKKKEMDNFLETSTTSMGKIMSCVETLTQKSATQASSGSVDKEILAMSECISMSLKKVKTEEQLPCMIKMLQVIQSFCRSD